MGSIFETPHTNYFEFVFFWKHAISGVSREIPFPPMFSPDLVKILRFESPLSPLCSRTKSSRQQVGFLVTPLMTSDPACRGWGASCLYILRLSAPPYPFLCKTLASGYVLFQSQHDGNYFDESAASVWLEAADGITWLEHRYMSCKKHKLCLWNGNSKYPVLEIHQSTHTSF